MMSDTDRANKVPAMVRDECLWLVAQYNNLTRQLAEVQAKADELGKQNYRLIQELAEANAAFSEAVHLHQQERNALKADAERYRALPGSAAGNHEAP
jgi:predicted nuclease with TOPRIM domain